MVKDASITAPVKPTADNTDYEQRKREANFSDELQILTSLLLSFMVNKSGNYNCRQPGIIIVADQRVINCDWNYEGNSDEEHLKQLFYDMQKHPEIKKYILEVYFTQVRPWKNRSVKMTT